MNKDIFKQLEGQLVVSCQADTGSPLDKPIHISALAEAAISGGASGIRIQGVENILAVRRTLTAPLIGLIKRHATPTDIYITPAITDVQAVANAGADMIAFDATNRPRPQPVSDMIDAIHAAGKLAMADVSTAEEGIAAHDSGADIISTTMAGYTSYSRKTAGPDFALMLDLAKHRIPFAAEGRIWTLEEAQRCFDLGSSFIVVGGAITRPDAITRRFVQHITVDQSQSSFQRKTS